MSSVTEVVVVGAGQSGLAATRALQAHGISPVVLEAGPEPAGSWPRYYDSLTLFSPARYSAMPGLGFPGEPDHYPHRDEVARYLRRYAASLGADIRTYTPVTAVEAHGQGGFLVHTATGQSFHAAGVVAATGSFGTVSGRVVKARGNQSRRCATGQAQGSGYRRRRGQHLDAHGAHRERPCAICAFVLPVRLCQHLGKHRQCRRGAGGLLTHSQPWRQAGEIGSSQSGWLAVGSPRQPGDADRFGSDSKGQGDFLWCTPGGHVEAVAGDHCSHGVDVRAQAGHALQPDEIVTGLAR